MMRKHEMSTPVGNRPIFAPPEVGMTGPGQVDVRPISDAVSRAWQDVIGVPVVHPDDDFFVLGGHSVLAARMIARLRRAFGPAVELQMIYDSPQLSEFVGAIAARVSEIGPAQAGR
jgi:hypothetical protein